MLYIFVCSSLPFSLTCFPAYRVQLSSSLSPLALFLLLPSSCPYSPVPFSSNPVSFPSSSSSSLFPPPLPPPSYISPFPISTFIALSSSSSYLPPPFPASPPPLPRRPRPSLLFSHGKAVWECARARGLSWLISHPR